MIWLAIVSVTNATELTAAIDNATAGDEIVLADGDYALAANVTCDAVGTSAEPVVVRAASPLGAHLAFNASEGFKVTGPHWHFEGLDITGACGAGNDSTCEHAFHVSGAAESFVLRHSRVRDFNAQLKVNAQLIGASYAIPHRGLIEYNEIGDTRARMTSNPVTKLNIDTGDDWIVRGNYIHDGQKSGGDNTSYASFMKSGGNRGLFERNLVICSRDTMGGARIGLSFGGGGTGNAFCAPAFDPGVDCVVEHTGGTMRNNVIVNCSDVGIYLNESVDTHLLYNTLIATNGIDFRFATTTGEAVGNLMTSVARQRDGGTMTTNGNVENVALSQFQQWYASPLTGDLSVLGDVSSLIGAGPMRADVKNDYCGALRPNGALTVGALEHSVAVCDTTRPPVQTDPGTDGDGAPSGDAGPGGPGGETGGDSGCCQAQRTPDGSALFLLFVLAYVVRPGRSRQLRSARQRR